MLTEHAHSPDSGRVYTWWQRPAFDPLRRLIHNPQRILAGLVQPGDTALDLGCGMGYFAPALARMVGPQGTVICVDLEERLLAEVRRRAERAGVTERIRLHRAEAGHLGLEEPVDFALAFWVVHEVRDQAAFLAQVRACLKPGGRLLIVEPRGEVGEAAFERTVAIAGATGLVATARPVVTWSRACLFEVPYP